ncbi:hypothetical protein MLD38_023118 [Melastoma candidum]|uniref:Uncharacterized protein n=1 Tax=Melastoma candidum TaxID=119954 RepID=A0ACB9QLI5_9MYRT|nr:hypothetical protein MLD38_023118 [Melastoma candidum]
MGSGRGGGSGGNVEVAGGLDQLPAALIASIMIKLDVSSICSAGSTCRSLRSCASHVLSFLPDFHLLDIAPSTEQLRPLLPCNPMMMRLKVDCDRLNDNAIDLLLRPSLQELHLRNCSDFSGRLLSEIGSRCKDLKSLYLGPIAENRGRALHVSELEELLSGCSQLEDLFLMIDMSGFVRQSFARVWDFVSEKLTCLEIGYISSVMITELLSPHADPHHLQHIKSSPFPSVQKLSLSVDYITDVMVETLSKGLISLTDLDLRDAPLIEPRLTFDLTNYGLQQINHHGKLKHLCLIRSQDYLVTYFNRVNDLGILFMADRCASMESIYLGGFCRVSDAGFKTLLHSCSCLCRLWIAHGTLLTNLVFHDIRATSLSLTHVSLRWCHLLTNLGVKNLVSNADLQVLDLKDCKNLGDEALRSIGTLSKLKILQLEGSSVTDIGLSHLKWRVIGSLVSLSLRGCKRLTDKGISTLFGGASKLELHELDLSNIPGISDDGILSLVRAHIPILELRLRQCPLIGDTSVMALASMQSIEEGWSGSRLKMLDLYNCGGITALSFRWLKRPYFPRLRWLGLTGSVNRDMVDALARSRPFLRVACRGEELGMDRSDMDGVFMRDYDDEVDEFEQWLFAEGDEMD